MCSKEYFLPRKNLTRNRIDCWNFESECGSRGWRWGLGHLVDWNIYLTSCFSPPGTCTYYRTICSVPHGAYLASTFFTASRISCVRWVIVSPLTYRLSWISLTKCQNISTELCFPLRPCCALMLAMARWYRVWSVSVSWSVLVCRFPKSDLVTYLSVH